MMWFSFYLGDFSEAISRELQLLPVVGRFPTLYRTRRGSLQPTCLWIISMLPAPPGVSP